MRYLSRCLSCILSHTFYSLRTIFYSLLTTCLTTYCILLTTFYLLPACAHTLQVLERCSGDLSSDELTAEIVSESEGSVESPEIEARLRELYTKRLIGLA